MNKPTIALFTGDPAGIGPEIVAKVLNDADVRNAANLLIIGSRPVLEAGMRTAGIHTEVLDAPADIPAGDHAPFLMNWQHVAADQFELGEVTQKSGRFMLDGLAFGLKMCGNNIADAMCVAPLNKAGLRAGGMNHPDEMHYFREVLNYTGKCVEFNVNDKLWTSRVTSHVPHKDVSSLLTPELIASGVEMLWQGLKASGVDQPRVAVCGLNPHNGDGGAFGRDEIEVIEPGVKLAVSRGFPADGPFPADTTFVRAINKANGGGYDGVLTMYHDQGQIAMKLMSFGEGITVHYGLPMPITTPAHGTAYDIVEKGIAMSGAMKNALLMAAKMGASARASRG
ncbi:4-hydroxythreonine-4-phosphate dehydrogenase PdxA [Candidimonas sp. SYP-B2681]|uniref:4-hydroxythreonine-4-phosphate dehydrogenase PdxA n=1 Tax=Candidimonas sp. SYP-B2681 TaxID=2497686 RepID=UPI000F87636A|nr:4-hydroxythreonine-4-phosphate dehydrogenase PdxA [Candidimonas sp. SYP-B2681]RTZ47840.1 4-hydroxythreonine-4-phosphate dehydrogenase PdxA [Candidimonas sp. SYP-B2681]